MNNRTKFGLVGKNIEYSFSKKYFTNKFNELGLIKYSYTNFDLPEIFEFPFILYQKEDEFKGFNVTIPYKQEIIKYLNELDETSISVGAVNTIKVSEDNKLIGFNTDVYGFQKSLQPILKKHHTKALILGTGGASKAIAFALKKLAIEFKIVSRYKAENVITYSELTKEIMDDYKLIINCTPLGTSPNTEQYPDLPYEYLGDKHLLYDLVYNPEMTKFLVKGKKRGAIIKNGYEMLELQAEKSWEIWNS